MKINEVSVEQLDKGFYLQFNGEKDWSIVQLNCFERFLRWLGFYSSTHLGTITEKLTHEDSVPPELRDKIIGCWNRTYPNKNCGLSALEDLSETPVQSRESPPLGTLNFSRLDPASQALIKNIGPDRLHIDGAILSLEGGDILSSGVPCIVNAANKKCLGGGGIDGVIHKAAGPELKELCKALPEVKKGVRCNTGDAVITGSGKLKEERDIQYIIHAVGPGNGAAELLESTYQSVMARAEENGIRRLAIPAISTGIFGYHFGDATTIAIRTVEQYLHEHPGKFDEVKLVFLDTNEKDAKNFAWAIHIARTMEHPYAS